MSMRNLKLVEPTPTEEPKSVEDQVAELKARRAEIYRQANTLSQQHVAGVAEARLATLQAEFNALVESERVAMRKWAAGERTEAAPGLQSDKRKRLREEIRGAEAEAADERASLELINIAGLELSNQAGVLSHEIDRLALDILAQRVEADFAAAIGAWQSAVAAMSKITAWQDVLQTLQSEFEANKRHGLAQQTRLIASNVAARADLPVEHKIRFESLRGFEKQVSELRN
jgi:hypothetical protein